MTFAIYIWVAAHATESFLGLAYMIASYISVLIHYDLSYHIFQYQYILTLTMYITFLKVEGDVVLVFIYNSNQDVFITCNFYFASIVLLKYYLLFCWVWDGSIQFPCWCISETQLMRSIYAYIHLIICFHGNNAIACTVPW